MEATYDPTFEQEEPVKALFCRGWVVPQCVLPPRMTALIFVHQAHGREATSCLGRPLSPVL